MSHFTVMVIGPDHEAQLAPYHEFECTGVADQYVVDVDITDEFRDVMADAEEDREDDQSALDYALEYYGFDDQVVADESEVDRDGDHKFGFAVVRDGELIQAVKRTNPNKQWDWYEVGGRWTGMLKLKPGAKGVQGRPGLGTQGAKRGYADQARMGDIDWEGMRDEAGEKAGVYWDRVRALAPNVWESWDSVISRFPGDTDGARNFYHNQTGRQALHQAKDLFWCEDSVLVGRLEYVQTARDSAGMTFAFVKDGVWMERGSMGWWGMSTDDMPKSEWYARMNEMIDGLDESTLITIVDCHI